MIYLSLDTIKRLSNADQTKYAFKQCGVVCIPQISICLFLLIMMVIKVVIVPLSTTTLTANDLINLNLPRRLIFQGPLFGLSFLFNLYLFANMEEGELTESILVIAFTAMFLAGVRLFLEFFQMIFYSAHRTSLSPPPQRSLTSTGEISFSPTDNLSPNPTEGGAINAFV